MGKLCEVIITAAAINNEIYSVAIPEKKAFHYNLNVMTKI